MSAIVKATRVPTTRKGKPDSEANRILLAKLKGWRDQELSRQEANRRQMRIDEDFYDGLQLSPEVIADLLARGQAPVVYNEVKPSVDWLIGTELRTRMDHKVVPTKKDPEAHQDAQVKSKLLKYVGEVNRAKFARSAAFKDAIKAGLGWLELGVRGDPEDEPLFLRRESWKNMLYDSLSVEPDLSDSRYLFRMKWLDMDVAEAYFGHGDILRMASEDNTARFGDEWWFGTRLDEMDADHSIYTGSMHTAYDAHAWQFNSRERVQVFECWYFVPTRHKTALGDDTMHDRMRMELRCVIFCDAGILHVSESPYTHNRYPFIPLWCYRRARDNAPYGVIRNIRGPQESYNKRQSKALFVLSTNQVWAEEGAFDPNLMDEDTARDEAAAPDGFIRLAKGGLSKVKIERDNDIAMGHLQIAERDKQSIREVGGVTSENLGRDTNLTAGVALKQKADQGSLTTAEPFDNLRLARQLEGELSLALIEQFYTEEKTFRLTGERGNHEFESINTPDPLTGELQNPVTRHKAEFVVDEQDYRASMRQAAFESMFDLLSKIAVVNPQLVMSLLDLVIEQADIPGKTEMVKRIREQTGMLDPDTPPTPEQIQSMQAKQAAMDEAARLERDTLQSKIDETRARTKHLNAQQVETVTQAFFQALQAAQVVATVPTAAPIADVIVQGAGYVPSAQGIDPNLPQPAQQIPMQPPPELQQADGAAAGIETPQPDSVLRMRRGGVVPGQGSGDKVPALLEPGEVVMSNAAGDAIGREQLSAANLAAHTSGNPAPLPIASPQDQEAVDQQHFDHLASGQAAILSALEQIASHLTAEKELVRDESGKAIGVRVKPNKQPARKAQE